jgi:hypothetical protein
MRKNICDSVLTNGKINDIINIDWFVIQTSLPKKKQLSSNQRKSTMNAIENKSHPNENTTIANEELKKISQRSMSYWFEDGLGEIIVGALFLLLGLSFLIEGIADPGTLLRRVSGITALVLMVVGAWVARPVLRKLKERVTYPRTGYVSYRKSKVTRKGRAASYILALVIIVIVVGIITSAPDKTLDWLPMFEGVIIGGFLLFIGYRSLIYRYYALGTMSILLGTILSVNGVGNLIGMGILLIGLGAALLLSGGFMLRTYLHNTEPASELAHE